MTNRKMNLGFGVGVSVAFVGMCLRLGARSLAWPSTYSYSGERESTYWAIQERAYQDIALVLMVLGVVLLSIVFTKWLDRSTI